MGRLTETASGGIEAALRRDRGVVAVSLALLTLIAWAYLWRDAAEMAAMGDMNMAMPPRDFDVAMVLLTFAMWVVMMVGMMLPSAAPTILFYASMARKNAARGVVLPSVWLFIGGYLAAWAAFSAAVTLVQVALEQAGLVSAMMISTSKWLSASVFITAGIYQWLPFKQDCLGRCRDPLSFFLTRTRSGAFGALRMGFDHGVYCVGCCWMIMLLLFAGGVMSLVWVALIAGFVLVERVLPGGSLTGRIAGILLAAWGVALPFVS